MSTTAGRFRLISRTVLCVVCICQRAFYGFDHVGGKGDDDPANDHRSNLKGTRQRCVLVVMVLVVVVGSGKYYGMIW